MALCWQKQLCIRESIQLLVFASFCFFVVFASRCQLCCTQPSTYVWKKPFCFILYFERERAVNAQHRHTHTDTHTHRDTHTGTHTDTHMYKHECYTGWCCCHVDDCTSSDRARFRASAMRIVSTSSSTLHTWSIAGTMGRGVL